MKLGQLLRDSFRQHWKEGLLIGAVCGLLSPGALFFSPSPLPPEIPVVLLMISAVINSFLLSGASALVGVTLSSQARVLGAPIFQDLIRKRVGEARKKLWPSLRLGIVCGVIAFILMLGLDNLFLFFGMEIELATPLKPTMIVSGLALGLQAGFSEEALWRLGFMTLIAWLLKRWRWNLWAGNIVSALLFGAGHIPALHMLLKNITALLIFRTIVLNMIGALIFGYCYIKHGYESAVAAHFTADFIIYGLLLPFTT